MEISTDYPPDSFNRGQAIRDSRISRLAIAAFKPSPSAILEYLRTSRARTMHDRPVKLNKILSIAAVLFLANIIFCGLDIEWSVVRPYGDFNVTFYDELADAFLAGQTYLLRTPPPGLMALPDPWDPQANREFRFKPTLPGERYQGVHDLTLYNGRLYLEWGPVPALALIPLRLLAGHDLPMGHLVLVVETLAALGFAVGTRKLAQLAGFPQSRFADCQLALLFMLMPVWTAVLQRIAVYETAIFFSQLCVSIAFLSIVYAFHGLIIHGRSRIWLLAISSTFLGLTVNCRPDLAPLGLIIPILLYLWHRLDRRSMAWRTMVGPAIALGAPAGLLLAAALTYNYVRFASPFEVGQNWQLWGGHEDIWQHKFDFISLSRIYPNLYYYFVAPVARLADHPLLFGPGALPPASWMAPDQLAAYSEYGGTSSGLFVISPVTSLTLLWPLLFWRGSNVLTRWIVALLLLSGLLVGILPFAAPAIMRYAAEWCIWWLMAGILVAFDIRSRLRRYRLPVASVLFDVAFVMTTIWSAWIGLCFLLVGGN